MKVSGSPVPNETLDEVGLKSETVGVEEGSESIPWALLTPPRRGDQPTSERESLAIRFARLEPPSYGYRLPNGWAQAHATDQNPYRSRR